jgi:hypothetical protein
VSICYGSFNCYGNSLKSLEGGPKEVGGVTLSWNVLISSKSAQHKMEVSFFEC